MKPIKNLSGQAADKDNFFDRPREVKKLWSAINSGEHILFAAPRRAGKTSLLFHMLDNPEQGIMMMYLDIESVENQREFFMRLKNALLQDETLTSNAVRVSEKTKSFFSSIRSIGSDALASIEFDTQTSEPAHKAFERLLGKIIEKISDGQRLVIMLDEFAQAVQNIAEKDPQEAKILLLAQRELRQNRILSAKVQFLYCGSIGLEYVAERLDASNTINDVRITVLQPLQKEEAGQLLRSIIAHPNYSLADEWFTEEILASMLDKIRWFVPYYCQLLLHALETHCTENEITTLSAVSIDEAYKQMLGVRKHFVWWEARLKKAFKANEYLFAMALLNKTALNDTIDAAEISNLAKKHELEAHKSTVEALKHDGYIIETGDRSGFGVNFRFVSPVLQDWWRFYVAQE